MYKVFKACLFTDSGSIITSWLWKPCVGEAAASAVLGHQLEIA